MSPTSRPASPHHGNPPVTPPSPPPEQPPATSEREPILLCGPPGRLRTSVSVENRLSGRAALRDAALHTEGQATVTTPAVAVLPPGATATIPVSFRLDPATQPGERVGAVELAGRRRAARVVIEPDPSLRVSPARTLAEVGEHEVRLTISNDGNIPIPLAGLTRAYTRDGGPEPGPDVSLALDDPPVVEPGSVATVVGRLHVPATLDPTRRHVALVPVGTADIEVIVLPRTASEVPS